MGRRNDPSLPMLPLEKETPLPHSRSRYCHSVKLSKTSTDVKASTRKKIVKGLELNG